MLNLVTELLINDIGVILTWSVKTTTHTSITSTVDCGDVMLALVEA